MRGTRRKLTEAIVAIGVDREDAEYAVTRWVIETSKSIWQCVRE